MLRATWAKWIINQWLPIHERKGPGRAWSHEPGDHFGFNPPPQSGYASATPSGPAFKSREVPPARARPSERGLPLCPASASAVTSRGGRSTAVRLLRKYAAARRDRDGSIIEVPLARLSGRAWMRSAGSTGVSAPVQRCPDGLAACGREPAGQVFAAPTEGCGKASNLPPQYVIYSTRQTRSPKPCEHRNSHKCTEPL
jgi:hypothetical protein